MKYYYSKLNPKKILHIVYKADDFYKIKNGKRLDIVEKNQFIQLSALNLKKNQTFKPHKHIWKRGESKVIAQESWVVISGKVKAILYDLDDTVISEEILDTGDCSITLQGGHNYEILEDDTLVYEYKTGPYLGVKSDKEFI